MRYIGITYLVGSLQVDEVKNGLTVVLGNIYFYLLTNCFSSQYWEIMTKVCRIY